MCWKHKDLKSYSTIKVIGCNINIFFTKCQYFMNKNKTSSKYLRYMYFCSAGYFAYFLLQ